MVQINFALREVNCKIVFYGPGMSGKTTNLEIVHKKAPIENKGELTSIATEGDRTLFFDFMPLDLGNVAGMRTKFQLYTVPGQVYYNSTRKLVLQGADGVIFVADSSRSKQKENQESWDNLEENLREYGKDINSIPVVLQWNKRDLPDAMDVAELEEKLNPLKVPTFEAVAITGEGVFPTLKALSAMVLESLNRSSQDTAGGAAGRKPAAAAYAKAPAPAAATARGPASGPPRGVPASGGTTVATPPRPQRMQPAGKPPDLRPSRTVSAPAASRQQAARSRPQPKQPRPMQPMQPKGSNTWIYILIFLVLAGAAAAVFLFRTQLGLG